MDELASKGVETAIQAAVKFPMVVRVIAPGLLAIVLMFPLRPFSKSVLLKPQESWPKLVALGFTVLAFGWMASRLSDLTYQIFEGRKFWPRWLRRHGTALQQSRVSSLLNSAKEAKQSQGPEAKATRAEAWAKLRRYPEGDEGKPFASHPTLMGNILASYEAYPLSRYGMDSVFYWPRLMLAVDRETREDIDRQWAAADGLLSMAAVCVLAGWLWIVGGIAAGLGLKWVGRWGLQLPFGSDWIVMACGLGIVALSYLFYRMSLPFHLRNGELFKSVFDLYRDRLEAMRHFGEEETSAWRVVWEYLQYAQLECPRCADHFPIQAAACPKCGLSTAEGLRNCAERALGRSVHCARTPARAAEEERHV
jgi:hypothetical protein